VLRPKDFAHEKAFTRAVFIKVGAHKAELVLFAGFMVKLGIPAKWKGRVMNVHPALLPAFGGKGFYGHFVHEAVLSAGCKVTGATVHLVDSEYDRGPIVLQKAVEVLDGDDPEKLAARVQAAEREIYPEAVRLFAAGRLKVEGARVSILPEAPACP
jgi:phosphoribosylglycinamide formyltransferase-1